MAIRATRGEPLRWGRPLEWAHGQVLRLLDWFNQERWTTLLTLTALTLANLVVLFFLLQGQDNRAIAFVIFVLLAPLMWLIPELSVAVYIVSGSSLLVNSLYFAAGPGMGTGERTVNVMFLGLMTTRALYEYLRTPREERPRIFTWFTGILCLFWLYYMGHVAYIYLFRYHEIPADSYDAVLGNYRVGIFRFFDYHMLWIGVLPVIFLLRNFQRARRVITIVGVVVGLGVMTLVLEYFVQLPMAWKIVFQIKAAGETEAGYRVRDPAVMYLMVTWLFIALYSLGYNRGLGSAIAVIYILMAVYGVLITKNRALWAALMVVVPLALLWKPPSVLARQAAVLGIAFLLLLAGMFHPTFNTVVTQKINEAIERWQRNYAFGGDPRNDPSYQSRLREMEAWENKMKQLNTVERLIGKGLEEPYGRYISLTDVGFKGPRFSQLYVQRLQMHFPWLRRLLAIGIIGTALLALTLLAALIRIAWAFLAVKHPYTRALLMGVGAGTVALIGYDMLHSSPLDTPAAYPVILLWSIAELTFHWHRTGQLPEVSSSPTTDNPLPMAS